MEDITRKMFSIYLRIQSQGHLDAPLGRRVNVANKSLWLTVSFQKSLSVSDWIF